MNTLDLHERALGKKAKSSLEKENFGNDHSSFNFVFV